jgi:hypothetical protein
MMKNVYWSSCKIPFYSCRISTKIEFFGQSFEKYSNIKFQENPSSGGGVLPCGRTDGQTDMTRQIVAFPSFSNPPNKAVVINQTVCNMSGVMWQSETNIVTVLDGKQSLFNAECLQKPVNKQVPQWTQTNQDTVVCILGLTLMWPIQHFLCNEYLDGDEEQCWRVAVFSSSSVYTVGWWNWATERKPVWSAVAVRFDLSRYGDLQRELKHVDFKCEY